MNFEKNAKYIFSNYGCILFSASPHVHPYRWLADSVKIVVITYASADIITLADDRCGSKGFICACVSIRSITKKRMIPKSSNLVQGMNLGYPISDMIFTSKGQRSRSQSAKTHCRRSSDRRESAPLSSAHCLVILT